VNHDLAKKVADAVLYEGYMLYPYRPSAIKNRQRWSFGILYPPGYEEVARATERSQMHSECLLNTFGDAAVRIHVRFLHALALQVARVSGDDFEPARSVVVDGKLIEDRDEAVERSVEFEAAVGDGVKQDFDFSFAGLSESELSRDKGGHTVAVIRRLQNEIRGRVTFSAQLVREGVLKLSIDVSNLSSITSGTTDRDAALRGSLLSAHTILAATGGEFVSLLDPPDDLRDDVAACNSVGNFPVLVGDSNERDMLLCSPIVLYDYPQIAPESAGDFYDATEMDEMLTLRVMTLTDNEKDEMRSGDDRVRNLLQRTEESAREQLMRTHGTIRSMRPASEKP
jgi:hypothetical protein